jgi:FixJ family two-component response regulator
MKGGAVDFLTKPVDTEQLVEAVTRGLARSARHAVERRRHEVFVERMHRLTLRERQVTAGLIRGLSNKEIAAELGTAMMTVKVQRARVMFKLEVSSVAELVRMVESEGRSSETRRIHSSGRQPKWHSTC